MPLRGINTLSGESTLSNLFYRPSVKVTTKKNEIVSHGSKFFPFKVDVT